MRKARGKRLRGEAGGKWLRKETGMVNGRERGRG